MTPKPGVPSGREDLNRRFGEWYEPSGKHQLIRAGQIVGGRQHWEDVAALGALRVFEKFSQPAERELIERNPGYVFRLVKNAYLDHIKKPSRSGVSEQSIAEGLELAQFATAPPEGDPHWEVRHAVFCLEHDQASLIFSKFFLGLSLSEISRQMGLTRRQAERLHQTALDELRKHLTQEE